MSLASIYKNSEVKVVSLFQKAGICLTWSETPETCFPATGL